MTRILTFHRLGLTLIMATIAVGPFFQGYFFPIPTLMAAAVTTLAFAIWLFGRRQDRLEITRPSGWVTGLLLALTGWALLASAWSVYARGNLDLLLQLSTTCLAFLMLRQENSRTIRCWLVWLLSISALLVALLGLLEYAGFFMHNSALGDLLRVEPQQYRLFTVFQYPNTAATFFLIVILLHNAVLLQPAPLKHKLLLAAISGVLAVTFIFTLSRGAMLVAPLAVLLLWIGLPLKQIGHSLLNLATAIAVPCLIAVYPITQAVPQGNWTTVLLWTLLAALGAGLSTWALDRLLRLPTRTKRIATIALVLLIAVGGVAAGKTLAGNLPKIFTRITQIDASDLTSDGRFQYAQDTLKLVAKRPWGYGGGGWLRTYQQVQQFNYTARDPHNHYALTLVETGVPGLLLLVAAIAVAAFNAFRSRKGDPLRWAMAAAALTLAAHAAIDIDLSYFMMWLLLWVLLAAAQPDAEPLPRAKERRFAFPAAVALTLVTLGLSATLATAAFSFAAAQAAIIEGDNQAAYRAAMRAISLDPLNSQYLSIIPTPQNLQRALMLDPNNEELWRFVAGIKAEQDDLPGALAAAEKALTLRPMHVGQYELVSQIRTELMINALDRGRTDEALAQAQELISLGQTMQERGEPSRERQKKTFPAYPALTWNTPLNLAIGRAELVAGNAQAAETKLKLVLKDKDLGPDAALWLHALYTRTNNQAALKALKPQPSERLLNSSLYKALLTLP